jgi:hypothetical protein
MALKTDIHDNMPIVVHQRLQVRRILGLKLASQVIASLIGPCHGTRHHGYSYERDSDGKLSTIHADKLRRAHSLTSWDDVPIPYHNAANRPDPHKQMIYHKTKTSIAASFSTETSHGFLQHLHPLAVCMHRRRAHRRGKGREGCLYRAWDCQAT